MTRLMRVCTTAALLAAAAPVSYLEGGYRPATLAVTMTNDSKANQIQVYDAGTNVLLQTLSARLGIVSGRDLAQACGESYSRPLAITLWILCEIAIAACDLAEVIGTAIGLNLLFGVPLELGVLITALDVFLILWMQNLGFRWIEAFIVTLLGVIAVCFAVQIAMASPDWRAVIVGFAPTVEIVKNPAMLYLAIGIIGATVMPHNLFLHSGVVQTRRYGESVEDRREAINLATIDSTIALTFALLINASILILAAATFNKTGQTDISELGEVHKLIAPLLGSAWAPTLFGIALLCCGLNSTITATLSGQIVMEGFLQLRIAPWLRRLLTRLVAIVPAVLVTIWAGEKATGQLLILSQVVLSLQLPFAVVPLVMFTSNRRKMGPFTAPRWLTALATLLAVAVAIGPGRNACTWSARKPFFFSHRASSSMSWSLVPGCAAMKYGIRYCSLPASFEYRSNSSLKRS